MRTLHDPDDAADALQEAMISAFRRAAEFRGDAAVTTWLHRIVVNACLDQLRRRAARPTVPADDEAALDALGQRQGRLAPDPAPASDTALDVEAALQLLPAGQRAALVLVDMLGYSVATAADVLGVSPGTVKSRCARGRARLLPHLAHLRNTGPPRDPARNQTTAGYVPPSQGAQPPPGVPAAGRPASHRAPPVPAACSPARASRATRPRQPTSEQPGKEEAQTMLGHPDADALAACREGLLGRRRQARIRAHLARCSRCASLDQELTAVSTLLASAPAPRIPDELAARLDTVLAAESAARARGESHTAADGIPAAAGQAPVPAAAGETGRHRGPGRGRAAARARRSPARAARTTRPWRVTALRAASVTAVLLVIAGGGYGVSRLLQTGSGVSSSASSGSACQGAQPGGSSAGLRGRRVTRWPGLPAGGQDTRGRPAGGAQRHQLPAGSAGRPGEAGTGSTIAPVPRRTRPPSRPGRPARWRAA